MQRRMTGTYQWSSFLNYAGNGFFWAALLFTVFSVLFSVSFICFLLRTCVLCAGRTDQTADFVIDQADHEAYDAADEKAYGVA